MTEQRSMWLVVLDDGETFSSVEGAKLVHVTEGVADAMGNDHKYRRIASDSYDEDDYPDEEVSSNGIIREIDLTKVIGLEEQEITDALDMIEEVLPDRYEHAHDALNLIRERLNLR